MNGGQLVALLQAAMPRLAAAHPELRDLDAALGDGDLGITVNKGSEAVVAAVSALVDAPPAAVLRAAGSAFASANPSTMAALVGAGLLAAAKAVGQAEELDREAAIVVGRAVAERVMSRGQARLGDKTVLDALLPSLDALEQGGDDLTTLARMVSAAEQGVQDTTSLLSQRGRAAWIGARSAGQPDPGATAYVRLLEALVQSWPAP